MTEDAKSLSEATLAVPEQELLPAQEVSDRVIDQVAQDIRRLQRDATIGLALHIGELIIRNLYGGDFSTWRSHGSKDVSFRKLTVLLQEDLSVSVLYRSVAIYELADRMGVSTWKHLGVSHVRAVLGLPMKEQERILSAAEEKAWTVDRIEQEVAKSRKELETGAKRGRPALPAFVKSIHYMKRFVEEEELLGGLEEVRNLDAGELSELEQTDTTLQARLHEVLKRLKAAGRRGQ